MFHITPRKWAGYEGARAHMKSHRRYVTLGSKNESALVPDNGPPRLFRFTSLGATNVVATLDRANNLLCIDEALWKKLTPLQQHRIERTKELFVVAIEDEYDGRYRLYFGEYPDPVET